MWLALGNGRPDGDLTQLLPPLAALAHFTTELRRRLAATGLEGLEGMLELYGRLRATLDRVPRAELERIRGDVVGLEAWLHEVARLLEDLQRVKRALGDPS